MKGRRYMTLKVWSLSLLMALTMLAHEVQAEPIKSMSSAINKAGRQRMLTQRIVKAYIMVGMDVQPEEANNQLLMSVELFERQLDELKRYVKQLHIRKSLAKVEGLWGKFRNIALGKVSRAGARQLLILDDDLLKAAHDVVVKLQKASGTQLAELVNVSGRQRMLSQRIAKFYMALAWGIGNTETENKMYQAQDEFYAAMDKLQAAKINTRDIDSGLNDVAVQWSVFERSFQLHEGKYIPLLIAMSSEKILKHMNQITGMYDQLGKRLAKL